MEALKQGPLLVLSAEPVEADCDSTPLFLSLLLARHPVLRLYCESTHPLLAGDARVVPTRPQRICCEACFRAFPSFAAPACDVCGSALRAAPSPCAALRADESAALQAAARADAGDAGAVLVVGQPREAALVALLGHCAGRPRVLALGASPGDEALGGGGGAAAASAAALLAVQGGDCALPGSVWEGAEAVADALGWRADLLAARAAAQQRQARAPPPPLPLQLQRRPPLEGGKEEEGGEDQAAIALAIASALASASASAPELLRALEALAGGSGHAGAHTASDDKFFEAEAAVEGSPAPAPAPPVPCFLYAPEGAEEGGGADSADEGEETEV